MLTSIQKWGNSLGVRIPSLFAKKIALKEGSSIEIDVVGDEIIIRKEESKDLDILLSQITSENIHHEIGTDEAGGNEAW